MTLDIPAIVLLHGACAVVYGVLAALILARRPLSRTGAWLMFACSVTSMKRKKFEKCMMPAMSVSENSTARVSLNWYAMGFHQGLTVSDRCRHVGEFGDTAEEFVKVGEQIAG